MKRGMMMLSALAVVLAVALPSWAQVRELPKQTVTVAGTVETIDKSRRAVNIKTPDGKFVALDVPASAKRFDELKVGDKVKATYNNNVIVRLKPAGEAAVDTADTSSTMGKGEREFALFDVATATPQQETAGRDAPGSTSCARPGSSRSPRRGRSPATSRRESRRIGTRSRW